MTTDHSDLLLKSIQDKSCTVGIIGLGYVGLPLIDAYIKAGFSAIGFDVDQKKVDSLLAGNSYIAHIEHTTIADWISQKRFDATVDMARLCEADVVLICVPTPLSDSRDPDLNAKPLKPARFLKTPTAASTSRWSTN